MKVAIVVPAFNEAESIADVVAAIRDYGTPIVVDDASVDTTALQAQAAGAIVVRHRRNLGYDGGLASGFDKAVEIGADCMISIDADGQLDASALPQVVKNLEGSAQLVLGVRSSGAARWSEALFNFFALRRYGTPDILCGLKGFRKDAYLRHRSRADARSVHTSVALALLREGAPFALVPVAVKPRRGASRYGGTWRANLRIFKAMLNAVWHDIVGR